MALINKLLSNPFILGGIVVVILSILLFIVMLPIRQKHKWWGYFIFEVGMIMTIPLAFYVYEYNKCSTNFAPSMPIMGSSQPTSTSHFDDIFSINRDVF